MTTRRTVYPDGKRYRTITLGRLSWDTWDWRKLDPGPFHCVEQQLFALRCAQCQQFTLGCMEHWFCGICELCRAILEDDNRA